MGLKINGIPVAGLGLPGKSAYQSAVDGGYQGTEQEFNEFLATMKSSVNADWSQNDETQADYIKNRTHYDYIEKDYILQDRVISYESPSTYTKVENIEHNLESDKIYTVIIDGIKYENLEVQGSSPWEYIGHSSSYDFTDAVYPFQISNDHYELHFSYNGAGEHTVSLFVEKEAIHYLDPKYIKDMYYSESAMQTLIEEQSVSGFTLMQNTTIYAVQDPFEFAPVEGNIYKIIWDGTTYECKCGSEDGMLYIGNINYVNMQSGGDIPFAIIYAGRLYLATESTDESHTISINTIVENIHHIDPKYIKDMYHEKIINGTFIDNIEYTANEGYIQTNIEATLIIGETYTVVWDGTVYSNLKCFDYAVPTIGDTYQTVGMHYPFCIVTFEGYIEILCSDENATHTVSISGPILELVKIDEKYLPFTEEDMVDTALGEVHSHNDSTTAHKTLFDQKADINHTHSPSDWSQINPSSPDYIKNKPKIGLDYIVLADEVNGKDYVIKMNNGNLVTFPLQTISNIKIVTMPEKVEYVDGEAVDLTGMTLSVVYKDGTEAPITNYVINTNYADINTGIKVYYQEYGQEIEVNIPITISEFDFAAALIDFNYITNSDGTYTITSWKGTLNGEASTEMIVPNNNKIIV